MLCRARTAREAMTHPRSNLPGGGHIDKAEVEFVNLALNYHQPAPQ